MYIYEIEATDKETVNLGMVGSLEDVFDVVSDKELKSGTLITVSKLAIYMTGTEFVKSFEWDTV